jgi:hypothetical protein
VSTELVVVFSYVSCLLVLLLSGPLATDQIPNAITIDVMAFALIGCFGALSSFVLVHLSHITDFQQLYAVLQLSFECDDMMRLLAQRV